MKTITLFALGLMLAFSDTFAQENYKEVSGIYVGGHIRRQRPVTITRLRNSGFTYVILFNVHVDPDGTLKTDGETICKDGKYVFQQTQPHYQEDIAKLKTEPTSITRIDICIGGWGNPSYSNIKNLINSQGTGSTSILYKNFKALKEAVPEIDAVNNDTEQDYNNPTNEYNYDVNSAAKFHIMMYDIGYKTTFAPYTNKSYWTQLNDKIRAQRPDAVDRAMIQCYAGGAYNVGQVGNWNFNGVTERHAGLLKEGGPADDSTKEFNDNMQQFQKWKDDGVATGGFVWVYNDEGTWFPKNSTQEDLLNTWASGMNRIFGAITVPENEVVVKCYSEKNYKGYCVSLPEGKFTQSGLAVYGLQAKDLSSLEILDDYHLVYLYKTTNCTGIRITRKASSKALTTSYDNQVCSISVEPNPTAIKDIKSSEGHNNSENFIYNISGQRLDKMHKGINIVNGKKIVVK